MMKKIFETIVVIIMLFVLCIVCFQRFYIPIKQKYHNNKIINKKVQYKGICLGESTTAGQYPIQLQQLLDTKYPNMFSIIDCGVQGANLKDIIESLDDNINKYKPNIAICMIGDIEHFSILQKLNKVYDDDNSSFDLFFKLQNDGKFKEAEEILKKILINRPNDENAFLYLTTLYYNYLNEKKIGYNMAIEGINKKFINKESFYKIIFEYCNVNNMTDELKYYINKAINEDISIFSNDLKYFLYDIAKNYITKEQQKKILEVMLNNDDLSFSFLAIEKLKQKDYIQAEKYFNKAEKIRLETPNIETYDLYRIMVKKLIDNNIKVICMQYPVRSIKPLKEQLKNEPYYDKLTFISNEKIFKDALKEKDFYELFDDQIGGDFGHCTDLGNTMIAENIVNTLENILNLQLSSEKEKYN